MDNNTVWSMLQELVDSNGTAYCYDRYCGDDEWTHCIFCREGNYDPHDPDTLWTHRSDCLILQARALLYAHNQAQRRRGES